MYIYIHTHDALLEDPEPKEVAAILDRKVRLFPLYADEIQAVLAHLIEEVDYIHSDADLGQWTEEQYRAIRVSLLGWQEDGANGTSRSQREPQRHMKMATFRHEVANFDWLSACRRKGGDNGTQEAPLYRLADSWETAWRQKCGGAVSSVVVCDPLLLLPEELRKLWQAFQDGRWPTECRGGSKTPVRLAEPFMPFREDYA
eukprot:s1433_g8.t1